MMLNSVDLPQPDGPMMDTNSPGAMEKEMSSTAVIAPSLVMKRLVTASTSSSCVGCGCAATSVATDGPAGRSLAALRSALTLGEPAFARSGLLPRRNLDQFRQLFLGERRRGELERDGILHDRVEPGDLVGVDRCLGKEVVA